jgi:hypothetical protein
LAVSCGPGIKAVDSPESPVDPAEKWDGNFLTIDLYVTRSTTCLVCHEAKVGMPEKFKKIASPSI